MTTFAPPPTQLNPLHAVRHATQQVGHHFLQLRFDHPALNTTLSLNGPDVIGVRSPFVPHWNTTLTHHGVHPVALIEAQEASRSLTQALDHLVAHHAITRTQLQQLAEQRFIQAMLPLAWQHAKATLIPSPTPTATPHTRVLPALYEISQLAQAITPAARALRPEHTFLTDPAHVVPTADDHPHTLVYRAALRGLSLQDMAARLPLRWDQLTEIIMTLLQQQYLSFTDQDHPPVVQPQLQAGETAPDFILPDRHGGQLRLHNLRGQRVWLTFNRHSTCVLCQARQTELAALAPLLAQQDIQLVSVWSGSVSALQDGLRQAPLPYPVLADPTEATYARYGLSQSIKGVLNLRHLSALTQHVQHLKTTTLQDERFRMPAEFLISRTGEIEHAHYAQYGADWFPTHQVLHWARQPTEGLA
ncbi:redoxin domain-containing protein [Deinococcus aquatilis]|uniref:redoxin domain-containing protein n=1 Tax=Deinococcus aquatilis TaxID=519440 RepID=UPI0003815C38|nr:redoxin domain-containing protein [Deinococcus aquatilis]